MKKSFLALILLLSLVFSLTCCDKKGDFGKILNPDKSLSDAASFEEDCYYSYMLSFPSSEPESTERIYTYYDREGKRESRAAVYLSYVLGSEEYEEYKSTLNSFSLTYGKYVNKPIYDTEHFPFPAYVFTWMSDSDSLLSGGVAEYVMLDDESCRVINVYKKGVSFDFLEERCGAELSPTDSSLDGILKGKRTVKEPYEGFSVYSFMDVLGAVVIPAKEKLAQTS